MLKSETLYQIELVKYIAHTHQSLLSSGLTILFKNRQC